LRGCGFKFNPAQIARTIAAYLTDCDRHTV
jgi:hypothetical protein